MTFFARPSEWTRARKDAVSTTPFAGGSQHYFAFLSYSHQDQDLADWLLEQLEDFRVPRHLVGRITDHGAVPHRLTPIFRDLQELPASDDLGHEIRSALAASRFLIVLCSPAAAKSRWANEEIAIFKRARPQGCVFAAIVSGEPFASDIPGREQEECLPPALRTKYDRRGRCTGKRAEPLAADLRQPGEARRFGFLKLVAGMLGIGLDDLVRRDEIRRHRHLAILAASSLAGMVVTSGLAIAAVEGRDEARDQRREAEGLISYMLGDLQQKLEPIGRLDALDGVGSRVLGYYQKQDKSELSDAALSQRSGALSLMASVANARGNLDEAERLYREALAGTAEAIRRKPDDPQRLFDHAQNVFYTADIALQKGDSRGAESAFREYKSLAGRMIALEPDNMKWRMEAQNADANLGILLFDQRRFAEAARQFETALRTIEAISTADPANDEYRKSLVESLAWAADAHYSEGRLETATAERQRHVGLLEQLFRRRGDVEYGEKLIPAHRALGRLYAFRGRVDLAIRELEEAAAHAEQLLSVEQANAKWLDFAARARLDLANFQIGTRNLATAGAEAEAGCRLAQSAASADPAAMARRALLRDCLFVKANLELASGTPSEALSLGDKALAIARTIKTTDRIADRYAVAKIARLVGDAHAARGDAPAAKAAWAQAAAAFPRTSAEVPSETSERRLLMERLGRSAEADALAARLRRMGYREPEFRTA